MVQKVTPIRCLQRHLNDLNDVISQGDFYIIFDGVYFRLVFHSNTGFISERVKSSDYEKFCLEVSKISRFAVREYMKDIVYPYKCKKQ